MVWPPPASAATTERKLSNNKKDPKIDDNWKASLRLAVAVVDDVVVVFQLNSKMISSEIASNTFFD